MIILGHIVIPHYYDHIILVHESDKTDEHDDDASCLLTQVYIKINKDEQIFKSIDSDFHIHFYFKLLPCLLFLFSVDPIIETTDTGSLSFRDKPYIFSYQIEYISHSIGLRAPPVC
jgi:hypothetical protein